MVGITDFDMMVHQYLYYNSGDPNIMEDISLEAEGQSYILTKKIVGNYYTLILKDAADQELIRYDTKELFDTILANAGSSGFDKGNLRVENATVTVENDKVRMKILAVSLNSYQETNDGEIYLFIEFK